MMTALNTIFQDFFNDRSAPRTHLTCTSGIYRYDFDPGLYSLVVEKSAEHPQTNIVRSECEFIVAQHEAEQQILSGNHSAGVYQPTGDLVPPVKALICDTFVQVSDLVRGPALVAAAFLFASQRTLQNPRHNK